MLHTVAEDLEQTAPRTRSSAPYYGLPYRFDEIVTFGLRTVPFMDGSSVGPRGREFLLIDDSVAREANGEAPVRGPASPGFGQPYATIRRDCVETVHRPISRGWTGDSEHRFPRLRFSGQDARLHPPR